jgi:hypothetical protein
MVLGKMTLKDCDKHGKRAHAGNGTGHNSARYKTGLSLELARQ